MQKNMKRLGLVIDTKERMIYQNKRKNINYVIHKDDLRKYEYAHNRLLISFILFMLISILNPYAGIAIGVVTFAALEFFFRFIILENSMVIDNFKQHPDYIDKDMTKSQLVVLALLYIILGGTLIAYVQIEPVDQDVIFLVYGVSAFAIFSGIKTFLRLK